MSTSVADKPSNPSQSPKKQETMYLSVINSQDAVIKPFKKLNTQRDWSTNLYNLDIESSYPKKFGIFTNKIDFINKNDDIEKSSPKIIHYPLKKPEYNLSNKDIEKSSPSAVHFKSKRNTNPLEPKYKLAKAEPYPPFTSKFIRDSIDIKDIPGASLFKKAFNKKIETMSEKLEQIEGTHTKVPYVRKSVGNTKYNYLDYSDVNNFVFKTGRHTNALEPIYIFKKENEEKSFFYGPIEKSKPESKYPYYYKPALNLKLDDIKGSNPGSKNTIKYFKGKDFELYNSDIAKANASSLKRGIITKRCTNPLLPKYQYLGETELKENKGSLINLKKNCDSTPLISSNKEEENEKNKENREKDKKIKIFNNISNKDTNDKLINKLNKLKIHKFNINIINKEKELKRSNSSMDFKNTNMKLDDINTKNKKIISFNPLLLPKKDEIINNQNESFDKTVFGKRPQPFYGFFHDPLIYSKDNKEHLDQIEREKINRQINKQKYFRYMADKNNNYISEEYKKNPNENNLIFLSDNPSLIQNNLIKKKSIDEWYNYNQKEKSDFYKFKNKSMSMRHLRPIKKYYSEKLDSFLNINNIQKNIEDRNSFNDSFIQNINISEYTKKALNQ